MVHGHLAESQSEYNYTMEKFGCSPVEWFRRNNLLGPRFYYAHCIHLDENDIKIMADTGTGAVTCPISNMYLSSGACHVRELINAGVERIGIGVDGAASSNSSNMMEEMRVAYLLSRLTHEENVTSEDVLYMATAGGAKALGRSDIGVLEPGKAADLTLLDWSSLSYAGGRNDPADCIVLSGDARMVDTVVVNGEIVVEKGRLLRIDEEQKSKYADRIGRELLERASKHLPSLCDAVFLGKRLQTAAYRLDFHTAALTEQNGGVLLRFQIQVCQQLTFTGCQHRFAHRAQGTHHFLDLLLVVHHIGPFHDNYSFLQLFNFVKYIPKLLVCQ